MTRHPKPIDLEQLKASILAEALTYGPVAKLVLIPDSVNGQIVCKMLCASSEYRSVVAGRHKGLVIGETVYFVISSGSLAQAAAV